MNNAHAARVEREIATYQNTINIHDLPAIFHHWSHNYLRPDMEAVFGSSDIHGVFAAEFRGAIERTGQRRIVSVGAGDGSIEVSIAERLVSSGFRDFQFDCLELSPHLIDRGETNVRTKDLGPFVNFVRTDLTNWKTSHVYGAAFAHHSLHHIVALEHVFDELKLALADGGSFSTSDMIGRNGHMRWPEVEAPLSRIWAATPDRYRYNHQLGRHEPEFVNFDCTSDGGFEGVRAQDIMPELLKRFHFEKFVAWGGLTDVFVDRSFGHNFSPEDVEDRAFVDWLGEADRSLLRLGVHTPTQMIAVMRKQPSALTSNGLDPVRSVRYDASAR